MDLTIITDALSNPAVWQAVGGTVALLLGGGLTGAKLASAAGNIVANLADAALSNEEKRNQAIDELYKVLPVVGRVIPRALMGMLVELMWQQVIKPLKAKQ